MLIEQVLVSRDLTLVGSIHDRQLAGLTINGVDVGHDAFQRHKRDERRHGDRCHQARAAGNEPCPALASLYAGHSVRFPALRLPEIAGKLGRRYYILGHKGYWSRSDVWVAGWYPSELKEKLSSTDVLFVAISVLACSPWACAAACCEVASMALVRAILF